MPEHSLSATRPADRRGRLPIAFALPGNGQARGGDGFGSGRQLSCVGKRAHRCFSSDARLCL